MPINVKWFINVFPLPRELLKTKTSQVVLKESDNDELINQCLALTISGFEIYSYSYDVFLKKYSKVISTKP